MIGDLLGQECTSIRQFRHRIYGAEPSLPGPAEFGWNHNSYLTLDVATDWTLSLSTQPWSDPFADADTMQRRELARQVGLWEEAPPSRRLGQLVGQALTSVDPMLNEVGELSGLRLGFDRVAIIALVWDGAVAIHVVET